MKLIKFIILFIIAFAVIASRSIYNLDIDSVAVITQFGQVKGKQDTPGLHYKLPFQAVYYFPTHINKYEAEETVKTKDNNDINLSLISTWKINDPIKYYQTVNSTITALGRLDDILSVTIRESINPYTIDDIKNNHLH